MCEREKLSKTAGTGDIRCPFFSAHGKTDIRCKDIYPEAQSVLTHFQSREAKRFHCDTYCKEHYKNCWLYRIAMHMMWDE